MLDRLVAGVLPRLVLPSQLVADLGYVSDLFDEVVQVEHENHLSLHEAPLDELLGGESHAVLEQVDAHFAELLDKLGLREELNLHVHLVRAQVVHEGCARFEGQVLENTPVRRRTSLFELRLQVWVHFGRHLRSVRDSHGLLVSCGSSLPLATLYNDRLRCGD